VVQAFLRNEEAALTDKKVAPTQAASGCASAVPTASVNAQLSTAPFVPRKDADDSFCH
jgi:hypothetical protein